MKKGDQQTPKKIVAAARQVFSEKGLAGARMHQIAGAAGVNQALLHYYFGSKEKLYQEVIYQVISEIYGYISGSFQQLEVDEEVFANFVRAFIDALKRQPELPRLILSEFIEGAQNIIPALNRVFEDIGSAPPAFVVPLIESAVDKGLIRPVDPMQTAISVIGMCLFYFISRPVIRFVWGGPDDEDRFLEERKEAIIDLALYGLLKEGE